MVTSRTAPAGGGGTFVVRPSQRGGPDAVATLSVVFNERVFHVLIRRRRRDARIALGAAKADETVTRDAVCVCGPTQVLYWHSFFFSFTDTFRRSRDGNMRTTLKKNRHAYWKHLFFSFFGSEFRFRGRFGGVLPDAEVDAVHRRQSGRIDRPRTLAAVIRPVETAKKIKYARHDNNNNSNDDDYTQLSKIEFPVFLSFFFRHVSQSSAADQVLLVGERVCLLLT